MAWSTRQLAEIAGTTVNTVRHYHAVGLLEEPERRVNGYKQYHLSHLLRLLQIRRLSELGVPLSQVEELSGPQDDPEAALRALDAELAASIERLQQIRVELAEVLDHGVTDLPAGFRELSPTLSERDRALVQVFSQVYNESVLADIREMLSAETEAAEAAFENLPAEADVPTRIRVATDLAPVLARQRERYPWLKHPGPQFARDEQVAANAVLGSLTELYSEAQLQVLALAHHLASQPSLSEPEEHHD